MVRVAMLSLLMGVGCTGASAAAAIVGTSVALLASASSRASGGCYASCPAGTFCDRRTGLCETVPCHGRCEKNETCVNQGWFDEHCEETKVLRLETRRSSVEVHDWPTP